MPDINFDLFSDVQSSSIPVGFRYSAGFIDVDEESALVADIRNLEFAPYEFRGVKARRRVASFGLRHGYQTRGMEQAAAIPTFLKGLRAKAAAYAGVAPDAFRQVLVSEYTPGTPIGWHKDRALYEGIVGVSLFSAAMFRFRRATDRGWIRHTQLLEPRSIYLLSGAARNQWQHSIPAVPDLRYSITFRSVRLPMLSQLDSGFPNHAGSASAPPARIKGILDPG
jgi:alkylated DNA repair dioxygenase AlkB